RKHRGHGHAQAFLEAVRDLCAGLSEAYDGMLLFSDIGPELYEAIGFQSLGSCDFYIWMPGSGADEALSESCLPNCDQALRQLYETTPLQLDMVPDMVRYHQRWRSNAPFAVARDEDYLHYKLAREQYVRKHSSRSFPKMELLCSRKTGLAAGYAILE